MLFNAGELARREAYNTQAAAGPDEKFEMLKMNREVDGKTLLHMPKTAEDIKALLTGIAPDKIAELLKIPDAEGKTPLDNIPVNEVMLLLNGNELALEPKQKYEALLNMKSQVSPENILPLLSEGVTTNTVDNSKNVATKVERLKMQRVSDGESLLHIHKSSSVIQNLLTDIDVNDKIVLLKLRDKDGKTPLDNIPKEGITPLLNDLQLEPKEQYKVLLNTQKVDKESILDALKKIPKEERFDELKTPRDVDGKTILHIPRKTEDLKTILDGVDPNKIAELLYIKNKEGKTPLENFSSAEAKALLDDLKVPLPDQAKLMEVVKGAEEIRIAAEEAKAQETARTMAAADFAPSVAGPNIPSQSPYQSGSNHQLDADGRKTWREENFKTEGGLTTATIGDPNKGHFKQTKTSDGKFEYEVVNSGRDADDRIQVLTVPRKGGGKPDIIKFDKAGNVTFFEEGGPGGQSKIGPTTMAKIQAFEESKSLAHVAEEKAPPPKVVQKAEEMEMEKPAEKKVPEQGGAKPETAAERFKRESEERGASTPQGIMNKGKAKGASLEI